MPRVGLYTLGCKVSQYETEAIAEEFQRRGYDVVDFDDFADAYVINTCTVTAESDRKSRQMIRRAISKNKSAVVAAVGCYTQRSPSEVAAIEGVSVVLGTQDKMKVVSLVEQRLRGELPSYVSAPSLDGATFEPMCIERAPRTRGYVKIEDGCECRCSYCAIADARGPVRSKPKDDIIAEVEALYKRGTSEIVLTGIETGSWGVDLGGGEGLADLILELDRRHSCDRLRLGSLAPELIGRSFVEKVKHASILTPHFHLSMQSGSDKILKLMRRRYLRARALENVALIRDAIPDVQLTTDLMVGFPSEEESDFLDTVSLLHEARFLDAHVFAYSKRAATPAASFPNQVEESVKKERSRILIEEKEKQKAQILDELLKEGKPMSAILETYSDGSYSAHTDSFVEISVQAAPGREGELIKVAPVSRKGGVLICKLI